MRSILRQAAVVSFAACLAFFCSCERHKVGELPSHEEHAKAGADDSAHSAHHAPADPKDLHANDGHKPGAHAPENAAGAPVGTPAQFFPSSSPTASPR